MAKSILLCVIVILIGGPSCATAPKSALPSNLIPPSSATTREAPIVDDFVDKRSVVFVCDCTDSMINKIAKLKVELSVQVQALRPSETFNVIFFRDEKLLELDNALIPASADNKRKFDSWLDDIKTGGTSDPVFAITTALKLKPQFMYFLTDSAEFPDVQAILNAFRAADGGKITRVNTVLLVENKEEQQANSNSQPIMRQIAHENGGVFKWVRMDALTD